MYAGYLGFHPIESEQQWMAMARTVEPPLTDPSDEVADRFEEDQPTPLLAAGTHDSLAVQAQEAARRAPTVEDEDVTSLAHDLKNPLTIIMLESTQIEQRLGLK